MYQLAGALQGGGDGGEAADDTVEDAEYEVIDEDEDASKASQ